MFYSFVLVITFMNYFIFLRFHINLLVSMKCSVIWTHCKSCTGFATVMIALNICHSVLIYGYTYQDKTKPYHYYEEETGPKFITHNVQIEYAMLNWLHQDGVINRVKWYLVEATHPLFGNIKTEMRFAAFLRFLRF